MVIDVIIKVYRNELQYIQSCGGPEKGPYGVMGAFNDVKL